MSADFLLNNRADLRRDFYALVGGDEGDTALSEYDAEGRQYEFVHRCIQHGLWDAQRWFLSHVDGSRWLTTAALTFGSAGADGTRHAALPADFLKLDGNGARSALHSADGRAWGREIAVEDRRGACAWDFWVQGERLYVGRNAALPSSLEADYHYRHADLISDDPEEEGGVLTFPVEFRPLINAHAALMAQQYGMALNVDAERQVAVRLAWAEKQAAQGGRRSKQGAAVRTKPARMGRWFT